MTTEADWSRSVLDPMSYFGDMDPDRVIFCPNPGNAGDAAIAMGAYTMFRSLGIEISTVEWDEEFDNTGRIVVYGGGGNLAASYPQARTFIERHHARSERLILLPHTIQGHRDLLVRLGSNVVLFCRELQSFQHARSVASDAKVYLADDLALKVDVDGLLEDRPSNEDLLRRLVVQPVKALRSKLSSRESGHSVRSSFVEGLRAARRMKSGPASAGRLYALRRDREALGEWPPTNNVDVSAVFSYGVAPEYTARESTTHMLAYLDRFERISTNRLHVCILAAMLDKEVDFHANSYFKNEAVYRYSLQNRFPHVRWKGAWSGLRGRSNSRHSTEQRTVNT